MISLIWGSSFKRAYRKAVKAHPHLRDKISRSLELFVDDPFHPSLRTHKLRVDWKGSGLLSLSMTAELYSGSWRVETLY